MTDNKLIEVYNNIVKFLHEAIDNTGHTLEEALGIAKEKAGKLSDINQDELDRVGDSVMRDIEHAASNENPVSDSDSLTEWLKFDIELLENFAFDTFMELADKTRVRLAELELEAKQYHPYKSGDVTGPGSFTCNNCGKKIAFKSVSIIPVCPECGGKNFTRI